MARIHDGSAVPMYKQLIDLLRHQIDRGDIRVGDRIPSEAQLGKAYGVSRITIRQALGELERAHLLERVPGKGTFVRDRPPKAQRIPRLSGFGENMQAIGMTPSYRTLHADHSRAPTHVADKLRLADGDVFLVERVLLADGRPVGVHTSYLPPWLVERAAAESFARETLNRLSLYRAMETTGVRLHRAEEIVEPALAEPEEAERLEMEPAGLVLRVRRTVYDTRNRPVEHVTIGYRADAYTYRIELYVDQDE